ncbi:MAG: alpha-isopropylmalate synthase regulatory domain-containing protein [Phycisphaerales bacterium]
MSDNPLFDATKPPIHEIVRAQLAALGKDFTQKQYEELYQRITNLYELKTVIFQEEVAAIAEEIHLQPVIGFDLVSLKTTIGPNILPTATILLQTPEKEHVTSQAAGVSSTDAICSAISEATQIRIFLKDLTYHTIIEGLNSLGQVSLTAEYHNRQVRTTSCSIDLLEAIAKAYLTAINVVMDRVNQQLD